MQVFNSKLIKKIAVLAAAVFFVAGGPLAGGPLTGSPLMGSSLVIRAEAAEEKLPPITGIVDPEGSLACTEGQPPALSDYPSKVRVTYQGVEGAAFEKELPVEWEAGKVDFGKAGSYKIAGIFTEEALKNGGVSNPSGLKASLIVLVQKKENINTLAAAGIDIESDGRTTVRLRMPLLSREAKTLYVYSSYDGKYWRRMYVNRTVGNSVSGGNYNFAKNVITAPPYQYVVCRYMTDYRPILFRVEVRGSDLEGTSNIVRFDEPSSVTQGEPLDKWSSAEFADEDPKSHHISSGSGGGSLGRGGEAEGPGASGGGSKKKGSAPSGGQTSVFSYAGAEEDGGVEYQDGGTDSTGGNFKQNTVQRQNAEETSPEPEISETPEAESRVEADGLPAEEEADGFEAASTGMEQEQKPGFVIIGILLAAFLSIGAIIIVYNKQKRKRKS